MKVRAGEGKWLLRQVLAKYVPRELTDRPKAGFRVPIGNWLRGPLREWADGLLSPQRIGQDGYLDPQRVRTHWSRFFDDGIGGIDSIWPILMFQAWLSALK
jgi:asparagine synthase (glutamine-hydrolysing)